MPHRSARWTVRRDWFSESSFLIDAAPALATSAHLLSGRKRCIAADFPHRITRNSDSAVVRHFSIALCVLATLAGTAAIAGQSTASSPFVAPPSRVIDIGQAIAPLYGPWKFRAGDSPVDPVTHGPLWAEPDFDDSGWESVDLTPTSKAHGPTMGDAEYVPGWTLKGHPGYWGYGWYRIRLTLRTRPGDTISLAGPAQIDDAYQVFLNGKLLGSFGDFTGARPITYYNQPMTFPLPLATSAASTPAHEVIAFRVWMEPNTVATSTDAGGFHSAPALGQSEAVAADHQLRWMTLIRNYSPFLINALLYALLSAVSFSLILFDRSDRVYAWIGGVFLLTAIYSGIGAFDVWTQHVSIRTDSLVVQCCLGPLAYGGWVMVWWLWFKRQRPVWVPWAASILTVIYMISNAIGIELFSDFIPDSVAGVFEIVSLVVRVLFFALLVMIVIQGIRRQGLEGWLVLPAVVLLGIGLFQVELAFQHVQLNWFPLGVRLALTQVANLLLVGALALLLLRRLLLSVRRQRMIALDAKRAQLQSDFVAAVSHEFRSPLTTLRSITDLLVQNRFEDEARRQQSYVFLDRETTRLHRLVEDLLDFGRMGSGRKQYQMEIRDAFDLVRSTVADFRELASANGFRVEADLDSCPAIVYADEEAFGRALRNLLENAMKYSPVCRTVWVEGEVNEAQVLISVRDQGMGIDDAEKSVIFQKFVRGDAAKRAGIKGTGIGLAMVQQISEALGGRIEMQSEPGVGSTFTLVLPLAQE
jgi:signal transduction histidine kinase